MRNPHRVTLRRLTTEHRTSVKLYPYRENEEVRKDSGSLGNMIKRWFIKAFQVLKLVVNINCS